MKFQKPLIIIVTLLIGGPLVGNFLSTLQLEKVDEELIPLDKAPIVSTTIKLTPEQELLAASIKSTESQFNEQIAKLESVVLEQVQRCFAIAVEEQILQSTAQEPKMSTQQFLVAQLNLFFKKPSPEPSTKADAKSENKKVSTKPLKDFNVSDSPACEGLDQNINLLVAISAYKHTQEDEANSSLLIEGLNVPASSLLKPAAANIRDVGIQNIQASYQAFVEAREKWELSHQTSWESESSSE